MTSKVCVSARHVSRVGNEAAVETGQVSLRPLSADAAARISSTRMRHFNSAPGDFRRQHSVLSKYDAQLMRSRTAAPDLARSATDELSLPLFLHSFRIIKLSPIAL